jgi:hypothetical protein
LLSENLTKAIKTHSDLAKWEDFSPMKVPWKKLHIYENSTLHCTCYCKWKEMQQSLEGHGTVIYKNIFLMKPKTESHSKKII